MYIKLEGYILFKNNFGFGFFNLYIFTARANILLKINVFSIPFSATVERYKLSVRNGSTYARDYQHSGGSPKNWPTGSGADKRKAKGKRTVRYERKSTKSFASTIPKL